MEMKSGQSYEPTDEEIKEMIASGVFSTAGEFMKSVLADIEKSEEKEVNDEP